MACSAERHTSNCTTKKVSFCQEIREFMERSRKYQSLYANTDGFSRKTFNLNDLPDLDRFIYLTIANTEDRTSLTSERSALEKETQLLLKKIYDTGKMWGMDQIDVSVVWVYYFDYDLEQIKSTPIFKIFKSGSPALYVDTNLYSYTHWDLVVERADFPNSFTCFPRGGEYRFVNSHGEDLLDLEFIKRSPAGFGGLRTSQPYSQTVVSPWLKLKRVSLKCSLVVCEIINVVLPFLPVPPFLGGNTVFFLQNLICLISAGLRALQCTRDSEIRSTISDCFLMLTNDSGAGKPVEGKNVEGFSLVHFKDILKSPGDIISSDRLAEIVFAIIRMTGNSAPLLRILFAAMGVSSSKADVWIQLIVMAGELCGLALEVLSKKNLTGEPVPEVLENGFSRLERDSVGKITSELQSSWAAMGELVAKRTKNLPSRISGDFEIFGYKIYIIKEASVPQCEVFLLNLLKSEFKLRRRSLLYDVVFKGRVIGGVLFLSNSLALIAVLAEAFVGRGGMEKKLQSLKA